MSIAEIPSVQSRSDSGLEDLFLKPLFYGQMSILLRTEGLFELKKWFYPQRGKRNVTEKCKYLIISDWNRT